MTLISSSFDYRILPCADLTSAITAKSVSFLETPLKALTTKN